MCIGRTQLANLSKYDCIGIGPGLGTAEQSIKLLENVLANSTKPMVIDADALNIISANKSLLNTLPKNSILTPHPKEFERLFGEQENDFARLQTAIDQAGKLGLYIILKGHRTAMVCPDGNVYFNSTGNAGMATGGSGDVLTGIITGLLSQQYSPKDAAIIGVYLQVRETLQRKNIRRKL